MWTFLIALILVFTAVDLLVKYVIDPLAIKQSLKNPQAHQEKDIDEMPAELIGATMYDGGKSRNENKIKNNTDDDDLTKGLPG